MTTPTTSSSTLSVATTLTDEAPLPSLPTSSGDSSVHHDIPTVQMSELDDVTSIPHAFNLPNLLSFRTDLLPAQLLQSRVQTPLPASTPPQTTTLLNLPDEVLDMIFRHLATYRTTTPLWDSATDAENAMAFAMTHTRLLSLFRQRLVCLKTRPEKFREDPLYKPPTAGAMVDMQSPQDVAHLSALLKLSGPYLRELLIGRSLQNHVWVDSYITHVTNLRKLSLMDVNADFPLEKVLYASSTSLRELELVGATGMALSQSQLKALGTYASAITSLALRLSLFEHDWTPVWTGVGPGLTKLSLGATRFWIMDTEENSLLEQIGRYCPDIRYLHFYHLGPTLGTACARLCARYGAQLETLELEQSQLLRSDLEILAAGCTDTEFRVLHGSSLFSHAYNVDVIDLLGPQIVSLRYRSQLAHDESLWEIPRQCSNLRELRLDCASTLTEDILESILKATAPELVSLSLGFFVRGMERALASSALALLARHANKLEEFYIGGEKFDMDAFRELARRCRNSLQRVSVTFGFRAASEREIVQTETIVEVIEALYTCHGLKSLVILDRTSMDNRANSPEIRRACFPFRNQVERISVCGLNYIV